MSKKPFFIIMNIKTALFWAEKELKNTTEPKSSALVLLSDVLKIERSKVFAYPEKCLSLLQQKKFKTFVKRRKNHEPVWQIIGRVKFWELDFLVTKDVLVPRPETELLVQEALKEVTSYDLRVTRLGEDCEAKSESSKIRILEVGTGSGAIIISLAHELLGKGSIPKLKTKIKIDYKFVATDISKKALRMAKKNAKNLGLGKSIKFMHADLFPRTATYRSKTSGYDFIFANLPYISTNNLESLEPDVRFYEPRLALDGGKNGLELYERLFSELGVHLKGGGQLICEIGAGQGAQIKNLAKKYLPKAKCTIIKDLAKHDRIATIKIAKSKKAIS